MKLIASATFPLMNCETNKPYKGIELEFDAYKPDWVVENNIPSGMYQVVITYKNKAITTFINLGPLYVEDTQTLCKKLFLQWLELVDGGSKDLDKTINEVAPNWNVDDHISMLNFVTEMKKEFNLFKTLLPKSIDLEELILNQLEYYIW